MSGKFYVYVFINDDWGSIPFYVGKGSKNRYKSIKDRSKHILSICEKSNWHSEIIRYFGDEIQALNFEAELKKKYKEQGFPIIDGEITIRKEAQREGIKAAKEKGIHIGRRKTVYPDNWEDVYNSWKKHEITAKVAMELTNLKRTTFYKLVKQYEE